MSEPMSNDELIEMFENDCTIRGMTKESKKRYVGNVRLYHEFLTNNGGEGLLNLNKKVLKEFVTYLREDRHQKKKTIDNVFSSLNAFYDMLLYEEMIDSNIILAFRRRFLRAFKNEEVIRKIPDLDTMSRFINSIPKIRDRAIVLLFCKTGIRKGELLSLDVDDIDWTKLSITLKPVAKRSNRLIFFDYETANLLRRWMRVRDGLCPNTKALFVGTGGERLGRHGVYEAVVGWAERFGLHHRNGKPVEGSLSPHSLRHWWTTMMGRGGARREIIQVLRGDSVRAAIDIYFHFDPEELRESYLAAVPQMGVV